MLAVNNSTFLVYLYVNVIFQDIRRIIPIVGDRAHVIAIAPEWLGLEEFQKGNYWNDNLFVEETKQIYKEIGFKRYTALSGTSFWF